ncbi:MAG: GIY-YIG nuclease family protein [Oscillospiraceae bacterium]|nr:GIY-YIG nuclease family protein [Oscillospiraceae bacterium]MBQ6850843.1 GIY-YIG nuclease family protein [Oscillospiraceae bacterium]
MSNLEKKMEISLTEGKWFVYRHTSPEGKVYVGITRALPHKRWGRGERYKDNPQFYTDIKRFGWDKFSHEIVDRGLDEQQALDREDRLIKEMNCLVPNGYNRRVNRSAPRERCEINEDVIEAKKGKIKERIWERYCEYLMIIDPPFTALEYINKKVKLPKELKGNEEKLFPDFLESVLIENQEKIKKMEEVISEYDNQMIEFLQTKKDFISCREDCLGTVYKVQDVAYFDVAIDELKQIYTENKKAGSLVFTVLDYVLKNRMADCLIEMDLSADAFKILAKDSVWEAVVGEVPLPGRHNELGENVFIRKPEKYHQYISLLKEKICDEDSCRIVFSIDKKFAQPVYEMLLQTEAEMMSEEIVSCYIADKNQYSMQEKNKVHYRLQGVLKKIKKENPAQYRFLKSKTELSYDLYSIKLKELEEKLYIVEKICSYKQESYIEFLVAGYGLQLKESAFVSKQVAQFLITSLKENKTEILEKYQTLFEEL